MRFLRPAAVVLALTAALAAVPGVASASASRPIAQVRIAHLSPDASYVDVYAVSLNRDQVFPNVFYKDVSAYWGVAAGAFTYEVRPAGADPTAPAMVSLTGELVPERSYTLALAGPKARLKGLLLSDDLSPVGDGKARVRFVDSLLDRGGVDVVAGGKVLAGGLSLGSASAYGEMAPGKRRVRVVRAGTDQTLFDGTLTLRAGAVTTAILTGGAGEPDDLLVVRDGAGVRSMPATAGGVATGAGGTAPAAGSAPLIGVLLLSSVAVVALVPGRRGWRIARAARAPRVARVARVGAGLLPLLVLAGCAVGAAGTVPGPDGGRAPAAAESPIAPTTVPAPAGATRAAPADPAALAPSAARPHLEVSAFPSAVRVPGRESAPVRLTIGAIGVDTKLVPLGLDAKGALQVPEDFARAGWFTGGPLPGEQGPAVIAGHVDSRGGPAVFYRLRELKAGDTVQVRRADGIRLRFAVESVHQYPKAVFPREAVFGTATAQALRLITCGGSFDRQRHSYRDNLIVDARLTGFSQG
jgi:Domain of unknown function (DUF4397)/Sortase domain